MLFILDHLAAVVAGAVLVLVLAALHLGVQEDNTATVGAESARTAVMDLSRLLERDLHNLGAGAPATPIEAFSAATPVPGSPVTALDFWTVPDTAATASAVRVRYEIAAADSADVERDGTVERIPLYTLRRLVDGGSGFEEQGRSIERMATLDLRLLDASGAPAAVASSARAVDVALAAVAPWGGDGMTREARWEAVIRPPMLNL